MPVSTPTIAKPLVKCTVTASGFCHWSRYPNAEGFHYCIYCGMINDLK